MKNLRLTGKKILSLLLVAAMLATSLTACQGEGNETGSSYATETGSGDVNGSTENESESGNKPSDSEQPGDTSVPANPDDSQNPGNTTTPGNTSKPAEPSDTTIPGDTNKPDTLKPVEPEQPGDSTPSDPVRPDRPSEPTEPDVPGDDDGDGIIDGIGTAMDTPGITFAEIPKYSGTSYISLNGGKPYFETKNLSTKTVKYFTDLDSLGRTGLVYACLSKETFGSGSKTEYKKVKPTGWVQVQYNATDRKLTGYDHLYDRSHMIAWSLSNEDGNVKNLMTGTAEMNQKYMTLFENQVRNYISETGNHVMYRVIPFFEKNNLVATGVQMEAWSIEDGGKGICFNVFIYNVMKNVTIDYATGKSSINNSGSDTPSTNYKTDEEIVNGAYQLSSGQDMDKEYSLTGKITSVTQPYDGGYKNITVVIQVGDLSNKKIECYRLAGTGADNIFVGDEITVKGTLTNYNGKIQFKQGCTLTKVKKNSTASNIDVPTGATQKQIVDLAFSLQEGCSLTSPVTLTGKITAAEDYSSQYQNRTLTIQVEGKSIIVYRLKGTGVDSLKVGDTISVTGTVVNYDGKIEFTSGCSFTK